MVGCRETSLMHAPAVCSHVESTLVGTDLRTAAYYTRIKEDCCFNLPVDEACECTSRGCGEVDTAVLPIPPHVSAMVLVSSLGRKGP